MHRLSSQTLTALAPLVSVPNYDRGQVEVGIVHFGIGAFHRAHQAVVTEQVLAAGDRQWGIAAVNLRSAQPVDELSEQDGLFSVVTRSDGQNKVSVVGSIVKWLCASREPEAVLELLQADTVKIVTMTVSEKAYGLNVATGGLDHDHPSIKADIANPRQPIGIIGYLVEALAQRFASARAPFTVLCCDNLPSNGEVVRRLVIEMAQIRDVPLAQWIEEHVAFPSSMVDRIVPAATDESRARASQLLGLEDHLSLETESFLQWVIEDHFPAGRPDWTVGGALFVDHVSPYEEMKLRLLNGSHTLIAHLGILQGLECVRDVMANADNVAIVRQHMQQAAKTLEPVPGINIAHYIEQLLARFTDRSIAHRNVQIAMDTSQKLPQRILAPAEHSLRSGETAQSFAYVVALWCASIVKRGSLDDPRTSEILSAVQSTTADGPTDKLFALNGLFSPYLRDADEWRQAINSEFLRLQKQYSL
jgi:fructuronate reductase